VTASAAAIELDRLTKRYGAARGIAPLRRVSASRYSGSAVRDGIDPLAFAGLALAGALFAVAGAFLLERRDVR
jgi:hypothetical protein